MALPSKGQTKSAAVELGGHNQAAGELLTARMRYYADRSAYDMGLGGNMLRTLHSLPPATRRLKITFALASIGEAIGLSQFAGEADYEDVLLLFQALSGKGWQRHAPAEPAAEETTIAADTQGRVCLDAIMSEISRATLTRDICAPIDTARAAYAMDSVVVHSSEEFNASVDAYYLHLLRHTDGVAVHARGKDVSDDALRLLEEAFADRGGYRAALAEGLYGERGGMCFVLDALTEHFKNHRLVNRIDGVFKHALDPRDYDSQVALLGALMERPSPHLPPDIRSRPPAEFVGKHKEIIRTYVRSLDTVKQLLRSF